MNPDIRPQVQSCRWRAHCGARGDRCGSVEGGVGFWREAPDSRVGRRSWARGSPPFLSLNQRREREQNLRGCEDIVFDICKALGTLAGTRPALPGDWLTWGQRAMQSAPGCDPEGSLRPYARPGHAHHGPSPSPPLSSLTQPPRAAGPKPPPPPPRSRPPAGPVPCPAGPVRPGEAALAPLCLGRRALGAVRQNDPGMDPDCAWSARNLSAHNWGGSGGSLKDGSGLRGCFWKDLVAGSWLALGTCCSWVTSQDKAGPNASVCARPVPWELLVPPPLSRLTRTSS